MHCVGFHICEALENAGYSVKTEADLLLPGDWRWRNEQLGGGDCRKAPGVMGALTIWIWAVVFWVHVCIITPTLMWADYCTKTSVTPQNYLTFSWGYSCKALLSTTTMCRWIWSVSAVSSTRSHSPPVALVHLKHASAAAELSF